jgi:hypothetical protein
MAGRMYVKEEGGGRGRKKEEGGRRKWEEWRRSRACYF